MKQNSYYIKTAIDKMKPYPKFITTNDNYLFIFDNLYEGPSSIIYPVFQAVQTRTFYNIKTKWNP